MTPRTLTAALLFSLSSLGAAPPGPPISLDVKDAEIHNVLRLLADVGKVNIVVADQVKGKVTLELRRVPWRDALAVVLRLKGLGSEQLGSVIHVDTVENLAARDEAKQRIQEARHKSARLKTVLIPINHADASEVAAVARTLLTDRGEIVVDPRTNTLIVTDVDAD